jgi:hypothetical protein
MSMCFDLSMRTSHWDQGSPYISTANSKQQQQQQQLQLQ